MRRSDPSVPGLLAPPLALALLTCSAQSCVLPLDDEFADASADAGPLDTQEDAPAPVPGCAPLQRATPLLGLSGDLRSIVVSDGGSIWIADEATLVDGGIAPAAIAVGPGASADCSGWEGPVVGPAFAASPIAPDGLLSPLDLVAAPDRLALYYELFVSDPTQPLGLLELGVGLATRDPSSGLFVPTSDLLWSPDRPNYGTSVLVVGGSVYTFGCSSTGSFTANCFVARAALTELSSTAAYTYWTGDGWSTEVGDAAPIAEASSTVSVRPDPSGEALYIMTFVPPLGSTLVAESAPAPEGPWSAPVTLAACDLANAGGGAFCAGGQQHPELAGAPGRLVLTYDARTFTDAEAPRSAFWPRLVAIDVPERLR
jgi:hypothetical protein